ncbi:MAG: DNA primase, partial [Clostridia bacterium]|nr:DNA primase [Clostridia bacterium]
MDRKIIEEIKDRCNIEDVVRTYVDLVRAGSNYKGLCPFHSEKTPSFTVFPSTQNFYCFGCGAGGDVITFIMRSEMLEYVDAIEFLGKKAGIEVTRDETTKRSGPSRSR